MDFHEISARLMMGMFNNRLDFDCHLPSDKDPEILLSQFNAQNSELTLRVC